MTLTLESVLAEEAPQVRNRQIRKLLLRTLDQLGVLRAQNRHLTEAVRDLEDQTTRTLLRQRLEILKAAGEERAYRSGPDGRDFAELSELRMRLLSEIEELLSRVTAPGPQPAPDLGVREVALRKQRDALAAEVARLQTKNKELAEQVSRTDRLDLMHLQAECDRLGPAAFLEARQARIDQLQNKCRQAREQISSFLAARD